VAIMKTNDPAEGMAAIGARAKDAAAQVVPLGKQVGTSAVQGVQSARDWATPRAADAAQTARDWAAPRAADAVRSAREWAAPRLDDAADAVTSSVAPKVSSALHSAARQVEPDQRGKSGLRALLDWRVLLGIGTALAAAGATAAVAMRRRYASATAAAENATTVDGPEDDAPADDAGPHAEVNGQVVTPGS
jgi:hypothetical protein